MTAAFITERVSHTFREQGKGKGPRCTGPTPRLVQLNQWWFRELGSVTVMINHLTRLRITHKTPLHLSLRVFPERIDWGRKAHLECWGHHLMTRGPGLRRGERKREATHQLSSFLASCSAELWAKQTSPTCHGRDPAQRLGCQAVSSDPEPRWTLPPLTAQVCGHSNEKSFQRSHFPFPYLGSPALNAVTWLFHQVTEISVERIYMKILCNKIQMLGGELGVNMTFEELIKILYMKF